MCFSLPSGKLREVRGVWYRRSAGAAHALALLSDQLAGSSSMPADPNRVILTGENPFIRLSQTDGGPNTTNASFWRIITCPAGPGHVLYLQSELTENRWRIYADNIAMARWLQSTVQGMLNAETV